MNPLVFYCVDILTIFYCFTAPCYCMGRYCHRMSSVRPSVRDVDVPWPCKLGYLEFYYTND